ncbi:hypothetical protein SKAU_G00366810 [Synaphobranchus kaupii]|uniref:Platelet-derived growth factor N-terminal domain-containing protein n=1 Tax=Synaphobranchus kaupii TaxID=118154 RepID=A0A9Q1EFB8_SYNKA|nr:hypothetical protein SKAU_G00366810 [Synaphobranchus kaupii]
MSSWILQLTLLAACLRFGCAEGDPLPAALVEMVRNSPITSIQDLQLLLLSDSVEEDPDSLPARGLHSNNTFNRLPRSKAQPAQQALCKVRNGGSGGDPCHAGPPQCQLHAVAPLCGGAALLWLLQCQDPCSGVPVITQTRYLQVMKIQYMSRRPHYDKAVISVQDHVECRCQSVPKPARTTQRKMHPRRQTLKDPVSRARSKEELHRRDELKRNQNFHPDERQPRYSQEHTLAPRGGQRAPGPRPHAGVADGADPPAGPPGGAQPDGAAGGAGESPADGLGPAEAPPGHGGERPQRDRGDVGGREAPALAQLHGERHAGEAPRAAPRPRRPARDRGRAAEGPQRRRRYLGPGGANARDAAE